MRAVRRPRLHGDQFSKSERFGVEYIPLDASPNHFAKLFVAETKKRQKHLTGTFGVPMIQSVQVRINRANAN